MPRHSGRTGKVFAQIGGGAQQPWTALTDDGTHRKFSCAAGKFPWQDAPPPRVRINGVRSGLTVVPDPAGANDKVSVASGTVFLAGASASVAGALSTALTRPAAVAGDILINAITINSSGAIAVVAGTSGPPSSTRGAAGAEPYVPVGSILLAMVTLMDDTPAPISSFEIDGTVQERADIPGWEPHHFDGYVTTQLPLPAIHTGDVVRGVYGQWRTAVLAEIFDLQDWNLDLKKDTSETMGFGDVHKKSVPTTRAWSGKMSGFFTSPFWFNQCNQDSYMLLKFRTSEDDEYEWVGLANVDWGVKTGAAAAVTEDISFTGVGELKLQPVS